MRFVEGVLQDRSYHSLERKIAFFDFAFFSPKNFFLTHKLTSLMRRSSQAGLIDFWTRKTLRNHRLCDVDEPEWRLLRENIANRSVSDHSAYVFSIGHLHMPLRLLCLGLCVAEVVFVLEILLASNLCRIMCARVRRRNARCNALYKEIR